MKPVFIEGTRTGYGIDQCKNSITVGELIEILQEYDSSQPVYLCNDGGYTYGEITRDTIYEPEDNAEY